jgi:hypothetical protein
VNWYNVRYDLRSRCRVGINMYKVTLGQKRIMQRSVMNGKMLEEANLLCIRMHSKSTELLAHR